MASIDTLSIELTASTAKASAELTKLTSKLNTLNKSLAKTSLSSGLAGLGQTFLGMTSVLPRVTMGLGKFATTGKNTVKVTKSMSGSLASLYVNFLSLKRISSTALSGIKGSMDLIETYHYFDVAMSKIGAQNKNRWAEQGYESAEAYAQSFRDRSLELNQKMSGFVFDENGNARNSGQKSLGMDPDMVMQYQAQYAQMADSIGMSGEAALATSKAMTMLAGDWSSLRNLEFSDAFQKMGSALAGQSRAVRALGIDITQAALQQTAYNIGLTTSVANMDQATKAELRMITILDQSRVAWGDLANTLNQPANQLRMIQQNFVSLTRIIGGIFMPMIQKVLPYVNGLVIALQRLFQWVAKLLGVNLKDATQGMGGLNDDILGDLADDADNATDALGDTDKAAQKLKRTILGFDELHVLADNTPTDTGKSSKASGIGGLGAAEQALLDASLDDLLKEYEAVWNKAFEDMTSKAEEFAQKLQTIGQNILNFIEKGQFEELGKYLASGVNYALNMMADAIDDEKIMSKINPVIDGITKTFNSLVDNINFEKIGSILANGVNIVTGTILGFGDGIDWVNLGRRIANGFNTALREINWTNIGEALTLKFRMAWGVLQGFVNNLDEIALGRAISNAFDGAVNSIPWASIGRTLNTGFTKIWKAFREFVTDDVRFKNLGANFATLLNNALSVKSFSAAGEAIAGAFNALFNTIDGFINGTKKNGVHWDESIGAMVNGSYTVGGFDFKKLRNALIAGLNSLFENIDLSHAVEVLNKAVDGVLDVLKGIGEGVNWANIGYKIGQAFKESAKNWGKWFRQGVKIIKDILGELLKGIADGLFGSFGENFAKGFVDGIQLVIDLNAEAIKIIAGALDTLGKALSKLDPDFVEDLGRALGVFFAIKISGSLVNHLAGVVENFLKLFGLFGGKAAAGAAGSAGSAGGGILGGLLGGGLASKAKSLGGKLLKSTGGKILGATAIGAPIGEALANQVFDNGARFSDGDTLFGLEEFRDVMSKIAEVTEDASSNLYGFNINLDDIDTTTSTTAVDNLAQTLHDAGVNSETFKNIFGENMDAASSAVYGAMLAIEKDISNAESTANGFKEMIPQLSSVLDTEALNMSLSADSMYHAIKDSFDNMGLEGEKWKQAVDVLDDVTKLSFENSSDYIAAFAYAAKQHLGWTQEDVDKFMQQMGYAFPDYVATGTSSATTSLQTFSANAETEYNKAVKSLQSFGANAKTEYGKVNTSVGEVVKKILGIGPAAEDADTRSKGLQTKLKGWTSPLAGVLKGLALWATGEGVEGVGTKSETAQPKVEDFDTAVQSIDKDDKGKNSIGDIALGFKDVGTASGDMIPVVDENMFKLTTTLEDKGTEVRKDAKTIADNLTLGFAEDVKANTPQVTDAISDSMGDTIAAAKRELGINSPSTVFADIGANVLRGFINGIGNQISSLTMTMNSVVYYIKQPFEGVARDIVSTFNGLGDNIARAVGNLYWVGSSLSASFMNGFQSNRLALPHIGWNWNRITYGNGAWFDIPNFWVDWYAKGGIFTNPTIAGFGESGNEAALPLTNKRAMAMVSDAIVNSGGALSNGMSRDDVIEAVATGVAMAMGQNPQTVEVVVNSVLKTSDEKLAQSVSRGQARLNQRYNVAY